MALEDAADLAVFYDTDEHATAATYTPPSGSPQACTVIFDRPGQQIDMGQAGYVAPAYAARLRAAEITPKRGGTLTVLAVAYRIAVVEPLLDGAEWMLQLERQV